MIGWLLIIALSFVMVVLASTLATAWPCVVSTIPARPTRHGLGAGNDNQGRVVQDSDSVHRNECAPCHRRTARAPRSFTKIRWRAEIPYDPAISPNLNRCPMSDQPSPNRRGRPTRAQLSAKVLANVDPAKVDPWLILATIASDASAPAAARVSACRTLLDRDRNDEASASANTRINARAVALMRQAN
jgi:hypothetical protein